MANDPEIIISDAAKLEYLNGLIGRMFKILHLFEEESETGYSPKKFIAGQLYEINAANALFNGKLIPIIVKIKGIYDGSKTMSYEGVKKQVFEINKIIKSMQRALR